MEDITIMSSSNLSKHFDDSDEDLEVDTIDVVTSEDNIKQSRSNTACLNNEIDLPEHEIRPENSESALADNGNPDNIYVTNSNKLKVEHRNDTEPRGKHGTRLPMSRIKNMMKMDEDCSIISQDAVFLVTKATEMFIETVTKETVKFLTVSKRKTLLKKDFNNVIDSIPHLCFLDGIFE